MNPHVAIPDPIDKGELALIAAPAVDATPRMLCLAMSHGLHHVHTNQHVTWDELVEALLDEPDVLANKAACSVYVLCELDGPERYYQDHHVPGREHRGRHRYGDNAVARYGLTLDFDEGDTTFEALVDRIRALGIAAFVHTSYSHNKKVTKPKGNRTVEETCAGLPAHLNPRIVGDEVHHAPHPKFHVIIPFARPWVLPRTRVELSAHEKAKAHHKWRGEYRLASHAKALNEAAYDLFAWEMSEPLNARFDVSCADITRAIYWPAKRSADAPYEAVVIKGEPLDFHTYIARAEAGERAPIVRKGVRPSISAPDAEEEEAEEDQSRTNVTKSPRGQGQERASRSPCTTLTVPAMPAGWNNRLLQDFELASALAEVLDVRVDNLHIGKIAIECPFNNEHSDPGNPHDTGCFVANASNRSSSSVSHSWPLIRCMHAHCRHRRTEEFIAKMLADGIIALSLFDDARFKIARLDKLEAVCAALRAAKETREARMRR